MQSQQSQYQKYGLDLSKYHLDVDFDKPLSKQTTKNDDNKEVTWLEYLHDEVLELHVLPGGCKGQRRQRTEDHR